MTGRPKIFTGSKYEPSAQPSVAEQPEDLTASSKKLKVEPPPLLALPLGYRGSPAP